MNKKATMILSCIAAGLMLAGCGKQEEGNSQAATSAAKESTTVTTAQETTAETTAAEAATTAEAAAAEAATTEAAQEAAPTEADNTAEGGPTEAQAAGIVNAIKSLERLGGCGLSYDAETVYTSESGINYYKVTESGFTGTADIKAIQDSYISQNMINERYSYLIGGESPFYIDVEGALYMQNYARGFYIFQETAPKIEKTSENGWSILADFDNFGGIDTADIRVVNENGTWKADSISFGS
ncbi:hypothetical protein [uncultured Ruminococcus sp.]|uniref:hypothetical protein n=1 Tax=uncultured Ruminococcus sp. TaxID=165186 RepID=UPI00260B4D10|nr:hypothetical protein [uncultured Ruminococcus sp.]